MAQQTNVFFTGATGYIGGSVLQRLLSHPEAISFSITVLVRSAEKAKVLELFGVKTIIGSNSDLGKLEDAAAASDVVLSIADCDDLPAATAILKGMKKRYEETEVKPILIHTSGTGTLMDDAQGRYATDVVYSDLDIPSIESLGPKQLHRWVDTAIVAAGEEGYVRTHIILPSMVFGPGSGPLFDKGVCNPHSMQVPMMLQVTWDRGVSGVMGPGKNVWSLVHVDDTADLFIVLFDKARADPSVDNGREGYYFAENGQFNQYELAKVVGKALVDLGRIKSAEPTSLTQEELEKYFAGMMVFGTNSRCKGDRSRALGWTPKKTLQDLLDSVKPEAEAMIRSGVIEDRSRMEAMFGRHA